MKPNEKIVATVTRIEWEEKTGKLFIVFEVKDEKYKQDIKKNWANDIEYKLIDKSLVLKEEE